MERTESVHWGGEKMQLVDKLLACCAWVLGLIPCTVSICNPSTWEIEAGGSEIQGSLQLHMEFEKILSYVRSHLKTDKQTKLTEVHPCSTFPHVMMGSVVHLTFNQHKQYSNAELMDKTCHLLLTTVLPPKSIIVICKEATWGWGKWGKIKERIFYKDLGEFRILEMTGKITMGHHHSQLWTNMGNWAYREYQYSTALIGRSSNHEQIYEEEEASGILNKS